MSLSGIGSVTERDSTVMDEPPLTPGLSASHSMQASEDSTDLESSTSQGRSPKRQRLNGTHSNHSNYFEADHDDGSNDSDMPPAYPDFPVGHATPLHNESSSSGTFLGLDREYISLILSARGVEAPTVEPDLYEPALSITTTHTEPEPPLLPSPGLIRFLRRKSLTWPQCSQSHHLPRSATFPR